MWRPATRGALRSLQSSLAPARTVGGRRFISSQPPHLKSRSWKSSALRWGIAIAGIYYYNTSPVFAEQPQSNLLNPNLDALEDSNEASQLDSLTSRRSRKAENNAAAVHSVADALSSENASTSVSEQPVAITDLEEEAEGEGAFNPETGEINWDCPCLGGMAHGPCGPEFREAFSCFVFSKEDPKGMDCIEKFESMRGCFQAHPDVYKDELMDDEEIDAELEKERQELAKEIAERRQAEQDTLPQHRLLEEPAPAPKTAKTKKATEPSTTADSPTPEESKAPTNDTSKPPSRTRAQPPNTERSSQSSTKEQKSTRDGVKSTQAESEHRMPSPASEAAMNEEDVVPKAAHDARYANQN